MRRLLVVLVTGLLLAGCASPASEAPAVEDPDLLVGTWQLRTQLPRGIDPEAHEQITLTFTREGDDLLVSGTAVCTPYSARAAFDGPGGPLGGSPVRFVDLAAAEGACDADALAARASYLDGLAVIDTYRAFDSLLLLQGPAMDGRPFGTGFTFDRVDGTVP